MNLDRFDREFVVLDDRGQPVKVRGGIRALVPRGGGLVWPRNRFERRAVGLSLLGWVLGLGGFSGLMWFFLPRLPQSGRFDASFVFGVVVLGGLGYVPYLVGSRQVLRRRRLPDAVVCRLIGAACPCCNESLRGLPATDDQCVVCCGCGGAWRTDRLRYCLNCGYDTHGVPIHSHGKVVCPECAAVFSLRGAEGG